MNTEPIVVEDTYNAPVDAVWKAITNEDEMRQWFFEPIAHFEPEVGFETEFDVESGGEIYKHLWKVTEVVPEKRISYGWRYGGYEGDSTVTWELSPTTEGTKLTLTHTVHEPFPQDNPVFGRDAGVAGWTYFVQKRLKAFVERRAS